MATKNNENAYRNEKTTRINTKIREMQKDLPSVVVDFLRSMLGNSPLTKLGYLYDIRLFLRYLHDENLVFSQVAISDVTPEMLGALTLRDFELYTEFLSQYVKLDPNGDEVLDDDGDPILLQNKEIGIARKLSALRSFYKYMYTHGLIKDNVIINLKMPKINKKPVVYLNKDEIAKLFDVVYSGQGLTPRQIAYNERFRTRDIAIISLLLGTGIRESEMIGLDLSDINMAENSFLVTRKGGDESILYFNDQVKEALEDYLYDREKIELLKGHENALFLSSQRTRLSTRALQDLVKKYATVAAPLKKRLSPHKLRSTFASNLYKNTHDIYLVSDALGHASIETVTKYAAKENLKEEAAESVNWVP